MFTLVQRESTHLKKPLVKTFAVQAHIGSWRRLNLDSQISVGGDRHHARMPMWVINMLKWCRPRWMPRHCNCLRICKHPEAGATDATRLCSAWVPDRPHWWAVPWLAIHSTAADLQQPGLVHQTQWVDNKTTPKCRDASPPFLGRNPITKMHKLTSDMH